MSELEGKWAEERYRFVQVTSYQSVSYLFPNRELLVPDTRTVPVSPTGPNRHNRR